MNSNYYLLWNQHNASNTSIFMIGLSLIITFVPGRLRENISSYFNFCLVPNNLSFPWVYWPISGCVFGRDILPLYFTDLLLRQDHQILWGINRFMCHLHIDETWWDDGEAGRKWEKAIVSKPISEENQTYSWKDHVELLWVQSWYCRKLYKLAEWEHEGSESGGNRFL